jgi:hypothetical protein
MVVSCEHGTESSGSIECWESVERLTASEEGLGSLQFVTEEYSKNA